MKERVTNNLGLKALAVFLAFFLWLIVSNVSNPIKQESREVTVEIINDDILKKSNLTYKVSGKRTVTVEYDVHTLDAYKISAGDFYAYADMSELFEVTGSIPVKIDVVNNKGLFKGTPVARPGVIQIETDEIQRKQFELKVNTTGAPADDYVVGGVTLSPDKVYVTGAKNSIGRINSIGVEIPIREDASADYTGVAAPVFYDTNGNRLDHLGGDVTLNREEIQYQVSVLKVKNLGLDFQVQGTVADGYRFTGVDSSIKSISVEGMTSVLASLSTLTVPGEYLNLDGATKDVEIEIDLSKLLPQHVTSAGEEDTVARIVLKVEALEIRGFPIAMEDVELIGASDDYEYAFNTGEVQIDIEGLSEDLDAIKAEELKPSVDVSDMEIGEHKGTVNLTLGEGFEAVKGEDFTITVTEKADVNESSSEQEESDLLKETTKASEQESSDGQ